MSHVRTLKGLTYVDHTDSILIGYQIGSADTEHGKLTVTASGDTVRFSLDGADGYVDLKLDNFASAALAWLARRERGESGHSRRAE